MICDPPPSSRTRLRLNTARYIFTDFRGYCALARVVRAYPGLPNSAAAGAIGRPGLWPGPGHHVLVKPRRIIPCISLLFPVFGERVNFSGK